MVPFPVMFATIEESWRAGTEVEMAPETILVIH